MRDKMDDGVLFCYMEEADRRCLKVFLRIRDSPSPCVYMCGVYFSSYYLFRFVSFYFILLPILGNMILT